MLYDSTTITKIKNAGYMLNSYLVSPTIGFE